MKAILINVSKAYDNILASDNITVHVHVYPMFCFLINSIFMI